MEVHLTRDWFDDELALVMAASNDPDLVRETYLPPRMDAAGAKRWLMGNKWAYFVQIDEEPVGMVLFHPKEVSAEVEIWVLPQFRGLGAGRVALREAMIRAAHRWMGLTTWVTRSNERSLSLFRSAGFEFTGRERSETVELRLSPLVASGHGSRR